MKVCMALGIFLLPSSMALAQQCRPDQESVVYRPECFLPNPKEIEPVKENDRSRINAEIQVALDSRNAYRVALDKLETAAGDEAIRKAQADVKATREQMYSNFNIALNDVVNGYHLWPPSTNFSDDKGPLNGEARKLQWRPRFSEQERYVEKGGKEQPGWRMRKDEELKEDAEKGSAVPDGQHKITPGPSGSVTWQDDDRISMYWLSFTKAVKKDGKDVRVPDADGLAALVAHETVHWIYNIAKSSKRDSVWGYFNEEASAHQTQAALIERQASSVSDPAEKQRLLQAAGNMNSVARIYREQAAEAEANHYTLEQVRVNPVLRGDKSRGIPAKWLGVEVLLSRTHTNATVSLEPPEEREDGRPGEPVGLFPDSEDPFLSVAAKLKGVTEDARRTFNEQERQRRADEIRRAEEEKRRQAEEIERKRREREEFEARSWTPEKTREAARRCGFEYYDLPNSDEMSVRVGYKGMHWDLRYTLVRGMDMDQVKMGFAFLRKCLEAGIADVPDAPLCIDDPSRLDQRWSEPGFRKRLPMVNQNLNSDVAGPNKCMWALESELDAPLDPKRIAQIAAKMGKQWRKEHEKGVEDWNRYRNPPSRPTPTPNRGGGSNGGGGGGHGGGNGGGESPQQRFCESRGCTYNGPGRCLCPVP